MITGILVALPEELNTLLKCKITQGECFAMSDDILVILSGSGPDNASNAAQQLLNKSAKRLISWGCAGALAPQLKAGDLIIPASILTENNTTLRADKYWSTQITSTLKEHIQCHNGAILGSQSILTTAEQKSRQFNITQALAVDMESAAIARVAELADIPFVVIRSIADPAHQDLPKALNYAMKKTGVVSITKLLLYIITHPTELPGLIKLGLNFSAASKTLKQVALHLPQITQVQ